MKNDISLKNKILLQIDTLKKMRSNYIHELEQQPTMRLELDKKKYLRVTDTMTRKTRQINTKDPEDIELAKALRHKRFIKKALPIINNDLAVLEKAVSKYIGFNPTDIFNELSTAYKLPPGKERGVFDGWQPGCADDYEFRSKSEQIIALVLDGRGLEYMYELSVWVNGIAYRPDFTIKDPRSGVYVYFEHFGMIDDQSYYEKMIKKLVDYWKEDIRMGENLIVTFETQKEPLTITAVSATLDTFFAG